MLLSVCLCALLAYAQAQNAGQLKVNTTQGVVVGASAVDGDYYEFFGLHYGGSVSAENRFKAPPAPPVYPGEYIAINNNIICAQPGSRGLIGVEDCLTLNVFTNGTTGNKPVLVWLIGDEYTTTDNTMRSFRRFVLEGVVVVQINYRLSIFGFLCLGVADAPGNAGLKDVVLGLKWIQNNIAGFGGDPKNVALFGHGSAGAMVDLITMSPLATNLFHKAITQSGSALAPWAVSYDPIGAAQTIGAKLSYTDKSNEDLAKLLAGTDLAVLSAALTGFEYYNNTPLFAPCIENPNLNPNDTFLANAPINLLRNGNYSQVPYISGYTDKEGTIRAAQAALLGWLSKMQSDFQLFLPVDLDYGNNVTLVERAVRDFYFSSRPVSIETIEDFLDYHGDTMILLSTIRNVFERALTSAAPVRLYEFAYKGTANSDWAYPTIPVSGARHGSVLNYLLDFDLRVADDSARTRIFNRYIGFLRTGSPWTSASEVQWQPITKDFIHYIHLSGGEGPVANTSIFNEAARVGPHEQRRTFWNDLYLKYYKAPNPVSSAGKLLSAVVLIVFGQLFIRYSV